MNKSVLTMRTCRWH